MVQLTSDLIASLDEEARRAGLSRSAVIRAAIENHLAGSREAGITARLVAAYGAVPQGAADEWGDAVAQTQTNTRRTLKRLEEEEEAAGLEW